MSGIGPVEVHRLRLPLARPWVSPVARMVERDVLLVAVTVEGTRGWGECVAQPDPTYSPEYVDGALDVLIRHLIPRLLSVPDAASTEAGVRALLAPIKGHAMARAALLDAVLDAELRRVGVSLADDLVARSDQPSAGHRPEVPAGVVVGVAGDVDSLVSEVGERVDEGYRRVKIKVHPGWDREPVTALRRTFGDELALQVDANASYAPLGVDEAARRLAALDDWSLLLVEQPLADDDLVGHAELGRRLRTPVCLDEAITSPDVLESALALGACSVVNIKPGRVGGVINAVTMADRCRRAGVAVWCGGMLETGVGRAVNLALASLPPFTLPGDLSASERYWRTDVVTDPARLRPTGTIAVPDGPGTGVELSADFDRWTVWSRAWTSSG